MLCSPSPLIEPDMHYSRIRLSEWIHLGLSNAGERTLAVDLILRNAR
jgi:hypothetical protein